MQFKELNLPDYIMRAIDKMGFSEATTIQEKSIPSISQGMDVVGHSETGSGKTLAYGIAAVGNVTPEDRCVQTLIICPTRELALQVTDEIRKLAEFKEGCKTVPLFGGTDIKRQIEAIKKNAKIIVGTPGRILDHISRKTLKLDGVKYLVLDEADEMLNMGFIADVEKIIKKTTQDRQTVMFSATMPAPVLNICKKYMREPVYIKTEKKQNSSTIQQYYVNAGKEKKTDVFLRLYGELTPSRCVIFCNTKRMVDGLRTAAAGAGINAAALHGDMRQNERKKIMDAVKRGDYSALIATDVAARGIDIDDVDYVFNYDLPSDTDFYLHRIGRTGRAGKSGKAITLISKNQFFQLKDAERKLNLKIADYYDDKNADGEAPGETLMQQNRVTKRKINASISRKPRTDGKFEHREKRGKNLPGNPEPRADVNFERREMRGKKFTPKSKTAPDKGKRNYR